MRNHGPTQRLNSPSCWQALSSHGAAFRHWASQGFGFNSSQRIGISGLGTKLLTMRLGDPTTAQDIARGKFCFAGETVTGIPVEVFGAVPPSPEWLAALHNLIWLQHIVTSGHELHRILARSLVLKWGEQRGSFRSPLVNCQALISLSSAAYFLVGPQPGSFEKPFYALIEKLIRCVLAQRPAASGDMLWQALAMQYASLAFRGPAALRDFANARLCDILNQVILPDGGHALRNPQMLLEFLLDVIPLRNAMMARHEAVPQILNAAIERMFPMLRMLSHGDRGLACFQGAGATDIDWVKSILEHDVAAGRPLQLAPHSGYARLAHRSGLLIMDTGVPKACNGPLAFEFSDGPHRIFSNCGMPRTASAAWQRAAADIAAHNTAEVASFESGTQSAPSAEVIASPQGSLINSVNEITGRAGKITHKRDIFLFQTGSDLRGEDRIVQIAPANLSTKPLNFALRFHLHPAVKATSNRKGTRIVIMLANKTAWQFSARGGTLSLEDSVFLGEDSGPRKTQQIVIRGVTDDAEPLKWALRRVEKTAASASDAVDMPRLPF